MEVPVIFVGGPYDGQTDVEMAGHREGDPPEVWQVYGLKSGLWLEAHLWVGTTRDTSENDVPVPFVWRAYSAEEQAAKWNDPDRPVKMWRATDRYPAGELEPELQAAA